MGSVAVIGLAQRALVDVLTTATGSAVTLGLSCGDVRSGGKR
jgi:hypothetical protein